MSKRIARWLVIGSAFLTFSLFAAPVKSLNKVVAIVNSGVITQMDLNAGYQQASMQAQAAGITPPSESALKEQVLNHLIVNKIATQLAKLNGIKVTEIQVDDAIANVARQNGVTVATFKQSMAANGINFQAYKKMIRQKLLVRDLEQSAVASTIRISPQEITNFIKNQAQQAAPKMLYSVQHILLAFPDKPTSKSMAAIKEKADLVEKDIQKGMAFGKAAMKYSDAGDALKGGKLKPETLDELPVVYESQLEKMKPGQVSKPFKSDSGYHIIKLVAVNKPAPKKHIVDEYHVKLIMVKTSPIMSASQAKTHLLALSNAIENGASFATVAKANSQDVASASNGGDLGWVMLSTQKKGLANAIAFAKKDQVSKPFAVGKDWYLIEVTGKRQKNDTEAYKRQQAERVLFQRKAVKAVQAWQAKIRAESYVKILN